jgi:hypothetical protein
MNQSPMTKLTHAYHRMMERVKLQLDEVRKAEQDIAPAIQHSIEHASETAVELGELTREEAQLISGYLKRDLEDAGHYLAETGADFKTWLRFDIELMEDRLLEWFGNTADRTRLELLAFNAPVKETISYQTGEITGPGSLQCDDCGKRLAFHSAGKIPQCPACGGSTFSRIANDEA